MHSFDTDFSQPLEFRFRWNFWQGQGNDDHTRLDAQDVGEIRSTVSRERPGTPFDVIVGGWPRSADLQHEREVRRDCERAGATWWQEWVIGGPDQVRQIIRSGPVRAD